MKNTHWTNYWKQEVLTSLPSDFEDNYDGEIATFWANSLESLPDKARILDVCTGNGAVAILCADYALRHNIAYDITAIDRSEINIEYIQTKFPFEIYQQIHFQSKCAVENYKTPSNDLFDLVVSQYGIEYTDIKKSVKNIHSLLKEKGQFVFITHSPDGDVSSNMSKEVMVYDWLEQIGLLNIIELFVQNKISANALKNKILACINKSSPPTDFLKHTLFHNWQRTVSRVLKETNQNLKIQKPYLKNFLTAHMEAYMRAQDMVDVVQKLIHPNWIDNFISQGFVLIEMKNLIYKNRHQCGVAYVLEKA